jgi:hypothetical protein
MNRIGLLVFITLISGYGCHPSGSQPPRTLVETPSSHSDASPVRSGPVLGTVASPDTDLADTANNLELLVQRDAHTARDILIAALHSRIPSVASWAAVYVRLLRVDAPAPEIRNGLITGARSDELLLQALCLRWLVLDSETLPNIKSELTDPVHQLFFALGQLAHHLAGPGERITEALTVGKGVQFYGEKVPLNTLLLQTAPFDDGPLALAIAFVNARRMEIATSVEGVQVPLSAHYRQLLLEKYHLKLQENGMTGPVNPQNEFTFSGTRLHTLLENPLYGQPLKVLRNAILSGKHTLGIDALRGLAATALQPEVADFAATATAFQSDDEQTRVEAARTYLLLVARATRKD